MPSRMWGKGKKKGVRAPEGCVPTSCAPASQARMVASVPCLLKVRKACAVFKCGKYTGICRLRLLPDWAVTATCCGAAVTYGEALSGVTSVVAQLKRGEPLLRATVSGATRLPYSS